MLYNIIAFAIRRKWVIGIGTLVLIGIGLFSLTRLHIDAVPDITNNQVQVITQSPNLAPLEIERYITSPVELATANIPGLIETRSISRFGLSVVTLVFTDETPIYWARTQVSEKLKEATEKIPGGVGTPTLAPVSTGLSEIYQYTLEVDSGYHYSDMELRTVQDWMIRRELLRVPGVADVSSFGGHLKQYQVKADPQLLTSVGVTLQEVFTALETGNANTGAAYIERGDKAYFIRGIGTAQTTSDIEQIVVANRSQVPVLIKDIATVEEGSGVRYGAMSANGKGEAVGGILLMLKGENASEVIDRVKERITTIEKGLPQGMTVKAFIDRESLVKRSIHTVTKNLIEGGLIVVFVLVLLLGNLRAGLVVASVIPLSMLFAITLMHAFGVSGNLMSLGAIDFGLIVDGAVIIVEIVVRKITERTRAIGRMLTDSEFDETVVKGSTEIMSSAAFGQLVILVVYLPILALTGIEGKMFKPMAITVVFAILGAFILCLTYVPMISSVVLSKKGEEHTTFADTLIQKLMKGYLPALGFAIRRPFIILGSAFLALVIAGMVFTQLGGEFIPELNEGDYAIETRMLPGTSLSQSLAVTRKVERILLDSFPDEVAQVVSKIGTSEIPTDPMPLEAADVIVVLKDPSGWTRASDKEELDAELDRVLSVFSGVSFSLQQPIQMRFNELMTSAKTDVVMKLYGEDLGVLTQKANELAAVVSNTEGCKDVQVQQIEGLPQVQVKYKREELARYGISVQQVNDVLQSAFAGKRAGFIFEEERAFDLVVKLKDNYRNESGDIQHLMLMTADGSAIPLKEIADVGIENGPAEISRDNTRRRINIGFNARGRDVESIVHEIRDKVDSDIKLPSGYQLEYGGQFENLTRAKERLVIVLPIALLLIYGLLFLIFRSAKQSLMVLSAVPLSAIGGVLALLMRDMPFSISAGVGFIALFGVAVLNGVVLIAYLNQLQEEGVSDIRTRVVQAMKGRFRPVMMTALVASLGFLPMALSTGAGAEVQKPLATVVIGGLISSTLLTLLVLPALYLVTGTFRKGISTGAIILLIGAATITNAYGQPVPVSMKLLVDSAIANHPLVRAGEAAVQQQKALRQSAFNPPPLNVLWQVPVGTAYRPSFLQSLEFPAYYFLQRQSAQAKVKSAQSNITVTRAQLAFDVKTQYEELAYQKSFLRLLLQQDSLYEELYRIAQLRFERGDITEVEQLSVSSQRAIVKQQLYVTSANIEKATEQLKALTGINVTTYVDDLSQTIVRTTDSETHAGIVSNPLLQSSRELISARTLSQKASKWRLLPGLSLGYFNQLEGNTASSYHLQFGIQVPLFWGGYAGQVKMERYAIAQARAELEYQERSLGSQFKQATQELEIQKSQLAYHLDIAQPMARTLLRTSKKSYDTGEINYGQLLLLLERSYKLQAEYLQTIRNHNQAVYQLQYLSGFIY